MQDALEMSAPEAAAFEGKSRGGVEMVEGLGGEAEKRELNGKHAYAMGVQDLTDQIDGAVQPLRQLQQHQAWVH